MSLSFIRAEHCNCIQAQWKQNCLLGINSLSYGNGQVTLLDIYAVETTQSIAHYVTPIVDTTIESIIKYNNEPWTEIEISPSHVVSGDTTFVCGEGGMGSEGFIAATNAAGLVWALFSTESNPFTRLELKGNYLKVHSDCQIYSINLDDLTDVQVQQLLRT